jgi:Peptidase A4 family
MITKHKPAGRRRLALLVVGATLALGGGFAVDAVGASAQTVDAQLQQSGNWAGYVVQSNAGQSFSSVSGSWTQPSVSSGSGQGYSAYWVGLGGAGQQSQSLEQVGTSADVSGGQTQYYAWYELLPAAETRLNIAIHPGDHISAKVAVNGTNVTVSMSDQTTGQSVTKTVQMSNPDTSSAEWIAEAPSAQTQTGAAQVLPLANFGTVNFTNASATAGGHTGSISDSNWSVQEVELAPSSTPGFLGGGAFVPTGSGLGGESAQSSAGASPTSLSSDGSSFSVSYSANGPSQSSSGGASSSSPGYGYGYGYGGDPNGYGGGYGYPGASGGYGYGYGGGYAYVFPGGYAIAY